MLVLFSGFSIVGCCLFGSSVVGCCSADPKAENLQCKFYLKDTNGNVETIRDYASDAECEWIPDKEGTYTVYVEAKDEAGNIATAHTEEITVNKKVEPSDLPICAQ